MVDKIAISLWNMFYYIVKITRYSAPLVLVILESEFDVIFKWMYVSMEKPEMLFYHKNQCFHLIAQIGWKYNYIYIFLFCLTNFLN